MDQLNINKLLNRENEAQQIKNILRNFELNKNNLLFKKGIYVYGEPGIGKTEFVMNILREMDYDVIKYDAGDIRNKTIIENITKHNMSDKNIMSMFHKKIKKIVIVMDEIDCMNNGDKGGINSLIKIIRPKKTKKQKLEDNTLNPIICIGNYHIDKKIKELMKVCNVIELKPPTIKQIQKIISLIMPNIEKQLLINISEFVQNDLKKLVNIYEIYKKNSNILKNNVFNNILKKKSFNDDTKEITNLLFNNKYSIYEHNNLLNDTDRTIVGLLWHENIIDHLKYSNSKKSIPFYLKILENICFSDYIDRITFQKQIWQFNEMTSLLKTFYNNKLFHEEFNNSSSNIKPLKDIRFTKVLTKYSTEYNNYIFIQNLCQLLNMDQNDLFYFFLKLKETYQETDIYSLFEDLEISKLDINRIFRFLDKYMNENAANLTETFVLEEFKMEEDVNSEDFE
jgi:DNA polymerase III delta prime subunit